MEQLSELPPLAIVVFGATLAVIFAVQRFGFLSGVKTPPEKSAAAAQVAAVIVDPTALNKATAAVEALTKAIDEAVDTSKEKLRVDTLMATELDRIREELRIQREVRRDRQP